MEGPDIPERRPMGACRGLATTSDSTMSGGVVAGTRSNRDDTDGRLLDRIGGGVTHRGGGGWLCVWRIWSVPRESRGI